MNTETTEPTQAAVCPFCFSPMTIEGNAWRCKQVNQKGLEHGTFPRCPTCGDALKLQRADPPEYWCAPGRVWFDGDLKPTSKAAHLE